MKNVVEVKHLTKKYGDFKAVDDLSFAVHEGEVLALLGPNGSGKTTTMNSILSLLRYNEGSIQIFGSSMQPDAYDIKKNIGVVFQDVAVFEELSVYENVDYFCGLYVNDKKRRKKLVLEAISFVGLEEFMKFRPKQLSGGLLRRLNIACGIAHKPKLIFFDEPTVAVDPQSRNSILEGILKLRDEGATIVYTTHYMEEVEIISDRVIILDKGRILADGTCDELKALAHIEEKITVEVDDFSETQLEEIRHLKNVSAISYENSLLVITYTKGKNNLVTFIDYLKKEGIHYERIFSERPTLNDVFLELTGKELRD